MFHNSFSFVRETLICVTILKACVFFHHISLPCSAKAKAACTAYGAAIYFFLNVLGVYDIRLDQTNEILAETISYNYVSVHKTVPLTFT
jgi:hypothetical protein